MKEKIRQFVDAKRGVSPVIGVVLMVAVVVILAAVIGAFVLGLGGDQSQAPQASFSVNDDSIIYEGGDTIDGGDIEVTAGEDGVVSDESGDDGELSAGDTVGSVNGDGTARVVYTGDGGSTTIWSSEVSASGDG